MPRQFMSLADFPFLGLTVLQSEGVILPQFN